MNTLAPDSVSGDGNSPARKAWPELAVNADVANLGGLLFYARCGSQMQSVVAAPEGTRAEPHGDDAAHSEEQAEKRAAMTDAELRLVLKDADGLAADVASGSLDIRSDTHALAYEFAELVAAGLDEGLLSFSFSNSHLYGEFR
jgi:hypothetical protein